VLLELKFEAPAPGLCIAARAEVPPLTLLVRATPFALVDEGVDERAGPLEGDAATAGGAVEVGRTFGEPTGGFLVAVDMMVITTGG